MTPDDRQLDILKELINIGMGKAAGLINQMVKSHVILEVPEVLVLPRHQMAERLHGLGQDVYSMVRLGFRGAINGLSALIFPRQSALWLVSQLIGDEMLTSGMDMDSLRVGTIQEVGNIVLNAVLGSIVNILGVGVRYFPPDYFESTLQGLLAPNAQERTMYLIIKTTFTLESGVAKGDIVIVFDVDAFDELLAAIDAAMPAAPAP